MGSQWGPLDPITKYICKHCKVEVVSKTDHRAILGREHGRHCPRRFRANPIEEQ